MAKKKIKKTKRLILVTIICFAINSYVLYSVGSILKDVEQKKEEKEVLSSQLVLLKEKQEELKVEVNKLQDADYVARYAREKYLYSGKNEYILKLK